MKEKKCKTYRFNTFYQYQLFVFNQFYKVTRIFFAYYPIYLFKNTFSCVSKNMNIFA